MERTIDRERGERIRYLVSLAKHKEVVLQDYKSSFRHVQFESLGIELTNRQVPTFVHTIKFWRLLLYVCYKKEGREREEGEEVYILVQCWSEGRLI